MNVLNVLRSKVASREARLDDLERRVAELEMSRARPRLPPPASSSQVADSLRALALHSGEQPFAAAEMVIWNEALRSAAAGLVRAMSGRELSARSLGYALRTLIGRGGATTRDFDGVRLEKVGLSRLGIQWRVSATEGANAPILG